MHKPPERESGRLRERNVLRRHTTLIAVVAALAGSAALPGSAGAYTHSWTCTAGSAQRCWDNVGANPNPWEYVEASIAAYPYELCAKAVTPAGNTRTGSGCVNYWYYRYSDIAGGTPQSVAYVYWGGSGGSMFISGRAGT